MNIQHLPVRLFGLTYYTKASYDEPGAELTKG